MRGASMYFKKIIGKKCYLSPIDLNDSVKFTKWVNDLEVANFLSFASSSFTLGKEIDFLVNASKEHNYEIIDIDTDVSIGCCDFHNISNLNHTAEIGIFIGDKDFWGRGYGTEALSLLIDYGFRKLNFNNVMLLVLSFNERAVRLYEKLGFKKIGERRKAMKRDLIWHNIIYMDLLPEDFYK